MDNRQTRSGRSSDAISKTTILRWSAGARRLPGGIALAIAALSLCACVASEKPLLSDTKPILGQQFTALLFRKFADGKAHERRTSTFRWQDGAYVNANSDATEVARFVAQPLQADDSIIQSSDGNGKLFRYWIGRKLMDGAYLVVPLDEADLDDARRDALCAKDRPAGICIVGTTADLFAMARANEIKPMKNAEIAVVVDEGPGSASDSPAIR